MTTTTPDSGPQTAPDFGPETGSGTAPETAPKRRGLASRLYRGETTFDFIGSRRRWYLASVVLIVICVASFLFRGFNFGVEFEGGSQFQIAAANNGLTTSQITAAVQQSGFTPAGAAQEVGSGGNRSIIIKTATLTQSDQEKLTNGLVSDLKIPKTDISQDAVSSTWGGEITQRAVIALIVFLVLVSLYLAVAFQWRMAVGAIAALFHDLLIAAGIYSVVGFEVTPSTVVGLLTILGFSLYDTVVVFDKIRENTRDITAGSRMTYSEATNLAVNQTLMRSINTSLISLLPVAGLLFVGAGLLGVGTIKDLALILFVGLASGAYSSLFLASPIVCDLTERQPAYRDLRRRVMARRTSQAKASPARRAAEVAALAASSPAPAPKPGARPNNRPRGKR